VIRLGLHKSKKERKKWVAGDQGQIWGAGNKRRGVVETACPSRGNLTDLKDKVLEIQSSVSLLGG